MDKNVPPLCHPKIASGIQSKSCVWLTCEGCRRIFSILGGPASFPVSSWLLFSLMAFSGEAEAVYTWSDLSWLDQSSEHSPMNWLGSPVAACFSEVDLWLPFRSPLSGFHSAALATEPSFPMITLVFLSGTALVAFLFSSRSLTIKKAGCLIAWFYNWVKCQPGGENLLLRLPI